MKCILRKLLLKNLNGLLATYKDDVESSKAKVKLWLDRTEAVNEFLKSLYDKLADNNISEDELKSTVDEFKEIVRVWGKEV